MTHFISRILLVCALALAAVQVSAPLSAQAQETAPIDYEAWQTLAKRAEEATQTARASDEEFASLRAELVAWRDRFTRAQSTNAARIRTLREQIEALGPPPAEGATETEEIATRRAELNQQLNAALAPVTAASEAFTLADGLVREIDEIIRDRQADVLLQLGPSPVNPALWPDALGDLLASMSGIRVEVTDAWASDAKRETFRSELPRTLLFLAIAALLVARGRSVMERLTVKVLERSKGRARGLAGFAASLGQIVVPILGIVLLVEALQSTGLIGLRGRVVTDSLQTLGICVFGARWLGLRLFPKLDDVAHGMRATPEQSRAMRFYATTLGLLIGTAIILVNLAEYENYDAASQAVVLFPLLVLCGLVLFRIGRILLAMGRAERESEQPGFSARGLSFTGRLAIVLGLGGVAMSAIGYLNAGIFLIYPTSLTLALLGLLLVLGDLVRELYALAMRTESATAREALIPTLIGFVLVLGALPLFALIWGARVSDLTEIWTQFVEGFDIGGTRISPSNFLTFVIVFTALFFATRLIQGALRTSVLPKTKLDAGGQTAITSGVGYVGIFLAALIAITTAGIDLSSIAIVAGALSVGIGFGLQNIVSNFVAGIILLIERPIGQGDWIEVGGHTGIVKEISVRSTRIETFDRTDVIVPNSDFIAGAVTNWTRANVMGRVIVTVGVAYGTETRRVEEILREIAQEHPLVTVNPPPGVDFMGFGADSLDFRIRAVLSDVNFSLAVKSEMHHRIAERFAEEGIEIPFAQRDVWLRNPEVLNGTGGVPDPALAADPGDETQVSGDAEAPVRNDPDDDEDPR